MFKWTRKGPRRRLQAVGRNALTAGLLKTEPVLAQRPWLALCRNKLSSVQLLRAISASLRSAMQCDAAGVWLPDADGHQMQLHGHDFPDSKGFAQEKMRKLGITRPRY